MLLGEPKPDKEINSDKDIIRKTLNELGIKEKEVKTETFSVSETVNYLFSVRYNIEKEVRRLTAKYFEDERPRALMMMLPKLVEEGILSPS